MTSSLVGSEMCIRDSGRTFQQGCSERWHEKIRQPIVRTRTHVATSETVSYTHLTLPTICSV
eukprot:6307049-Prorocentrum_lima.AAC.1